MSVAGVGEVTAFYKHEKALQRHCKGVAKADQKREMMSIKKQILVNNCKIVVKIPEFLRFNYQISKYLAHVGLLVCDTPRSIR